MSTRCNIMIEDGEKTRFLYHHHDGYPMFMGPKVEAFVEFIRDRAVTGADAWAELFVRYSQVNYSIPREPDATDLTPEELEEKSRRKMRGKPDFEHTDAIHRDIKYLWRIDISNPGAPVIRCEKVKTSNGRRHKINYLVAWKREIERSIEYVEGQRLAHVSSDPGLANELAERIEELREEANKLTKRIKAGEGK